MTIWVCHFIDVNNIFNFLLLCVLLLNLTDQCASREDLFVFLNFHCFFWPNGPCPILQDVFNNLDVNVPFLRLWSTYKSNFPMLGNCSSVRALRWRYPCSLRTESEYITDLSCWSGQILLSIHGTTISGLQEQREIKMRAGRWVTYSLCDWQWPAPVCPTHGLWVRVWVIGI